MIDVSNIEKHLHKCLCIFNCVIGFFALVVLVWAICGIYGIVIFSPIWFIGGYAVLVVYALFTIMLVHILYNKQNKFDE